MRKMNRAYSVANLVLSAVVICGGRPSAARGFIACHSLQRVAIRVEGDDWLDAGDVAPSFYPAVSSFRRLVWPSRAG